MDKPDRRASARREFIRTHHPDRGGDPAAFIAGLARFAEPETEAAPPRVFIVRDRPWPLVVLQAVRRKIRRGTDPPRVR